MRFTSDKLVYIDFNDIIFANLYIGKDQTITTLRNQLINLNELIRTVFIKTPRRYFREMLNTLHMTLIDGKYDFESHFDNSSPEIPHAPEQFRGLTSRSIGLLLQ